MYTDTILFLIGGVCAVLALLFAVYLVASLKRSRVYRTVLQQETESAETYMTTSWLTSGVGTTASVTSDKNRANAANRNTAASDLYTVVSNKSDDNATVLSDDESHAGTPDDNITVFTTVDRASGDDRIRLANLDENATVFTAQDDSGSAEEVTIDFDASALEGRYALTKEIHGGGMSRVFLANSTKLGNQWIVKFISNQTGELANEENILKLLNHISLPKIIDIFKDDKGVYLVESYIEGVSLDKVLQSAQKLNQTVVLDWAEQMAQVLNYLHKMEPHPIYHFDLKPSNIMVTHDNRLVLIDFGISKRFGEDDSKIIGVTYRYAAPEQLKRNISAKHMPLIKSRFGELPDERMNWYPDARTDIYSLGVILFELAVGQAPTLQNMKALKDTVSRELQEVINKCMSTNPLGRYQSVGDLLMDLQKIKGSKLKMARSLLMRKFASVSCAFAILGSGGGFTSGYYVYGQENAALLGVHPEIVVVSLHQSSSLAVEKQMLGGEIIMLDNSQINWSYSRDSIARVDGNRISGINPGETTLYGQYRNKEVTLNVRVVEPMDGMVDISQRYQSGRFVTLYAGTTERDYVDGAIDVAEFVSPESMAVSDDGTVYIADSGLLRKITDGQVESIDFEPFFLKPHIVRCYKDDLYILTDPWEDEAGVWYGIIKLDDDGAQGLYIADARYTAIEDVAFSPDGMMYFIDRNAGLNAVYLKTLNPRDTSELVVICELPKGTSSLTIDERGAVYLANPDTGAIQVWYDGELSYFAGVVGEKAFIDGAAPLFYMPQKVKYSDGFLYIWDFNVLRRLSILDGADVGANGGFIAGECVTIAGEASPVFDLEHLQASYPAEEIILPNSLLMDFAVKEDGVLLSDPKRGVIWRVG